MKINEKVFNRCSRVISFLPLIYIIIFDIFNIQIDKYIKFFGLTIIVVAYMLFSILYHLRNKPVKKKDLAGLVFWNLVIVILLIWWYMRLVS